MFERLQKPFLTVETGEAYQPIRLAYDIYQEAKLQEILQSLKCLESKAGGTSWNWFWKDECDAIHFESLDSYQRNLEHPTRLGTITLRKNKLYFNLPSFKRACLALSFFYGSIFPDIARPGRADFINKVFGVDERLPHGFTELFNDAELEKIVEQRELEFAEVQEKVEEAETPEEAFNLLNEYTDKESKKRLPYVERHIFDYENIHESDPDILFLGFFIYLRGRELVAIRRWFGESGYTLYDAAEETMDKVFGSIDIDIIE